MFRKINATSQSMLEFIPFVKVIKHCGKLLFFVISENIHTQNAKNGRGISIKISCSIAHSFCLVLRNFHHKGCKGNVAVVGIIPG
jgi:hypothetical protein